MVFKVLSKYEIRARGWSKVVRKFVTVQAYADVVGVPRETARDWINNPYALIPIIILMRTELLTGVSIEILSPFTEAENKTAREWQNLRQINTIEMQINEIITKNYTHDYCNENRIIVGTNGVLISGFAQLEKLKAKGRNRAFVIMLDLDALLRELQILQDAQFNFLITERFSISLRLKELQGSYQDEQTELPPKSGNKNLKNDKNNVTSRFLGTTFKGRIDEKIAKIVGLSSRNTYMRVKQVCFHGIPELRNAMDSKQIDIKNAAKISTSPKEQQQELLNAWLLIHKRRM